MVMNQGDVGLFFTVLAKLSGLMSRAAESESNDWCSGLSMVSVPIDGRMFVVHFCRQPRSGRILYDLTEAIPVCILEDSMQAYRYQHTRVLNRSSSPSNYLLECRRVARSVGGAVYYEVPTVKNGYRALTEGTLKKLARDISLCVKFDVWGGVPH